MKVKITKYPETLNGKIINGYSTEIKHNWESEFHKIKDADEWQRCCSTMPDIIFKNVHRNAPFGTVVEVEI